MRRTCGIPRHPGATGCQCCSAGFACDESRRGTWRRHLVWTASDGRVAVTGKHGESEAVLRRPAAGEDEKWPNLAPVLSTKTIDWDLIRQQYDQIVKYTTALRLGTAEAELLLRRFTRGGPKHRT